MVNLNPSAPASTGFVISERTERELIMHMQSSLVSAAVLVATLSWPEGWLGWVGVSAAALVGGVLLFVAILGLRAASLTDDGLGWFWISGLAGILPVVWRICRGIRHSYIAGLNAAGVSRSHFDVDAATPSRSETGTLATGTAPHGRKSAHQVGD